jgi:hypothetical protein
MYRAGDAADHVVVRHRTGALWIVSDGWNPGSRAAGPLRPDQVLRALRLSQTTIPDGCELGPWRSGLELFDPAPLPPHANDWTRVDPTWLLPSVSPYTPADIDGVVNEACCGAPRDAPKITWSEESRELREARAVVSSSGAAIDVTRGGILSRPWNVHPPGSWILSANAALDSDFVVIDLP